MNDTSALLLYCLLTSGRVQGRRVTDAAAPRRNVGAGPGRGAAVTCQGMVDTQLQQALRTEKMGDSMEYQHVYISLFDTRHMRCFKCISFSGKPNYPQCYRRPVSPRCIMLVGVAM